MPVRPCNSSAPPACAMMFRRCESSASAAMWLAMLSPRSFPSTRKKGWPPCARCCTWRRHRGALRKALDIAHLGGDDTVASLVSFIDGLPFKPGYRRFRIKTVQGIDDFASIREVVSRRFRNAGRLRRPTDAEDESIFPDIVLIDGGKGQLNAALEVFDLLGVRPPCLISLAKREEADLLPGPADPPVATFGGAASVAVRPRRGAPLRAALPSHPAPQANGRIGVGSLAACGVSAPCPAAGDDSVLRAVAWKLRRRKQRYH